MSSNSKENNKIARNTLFLYIRKIGSLIIALYTSRVLLQVLGVDNFGLYGLVGSIVMLFTSLRSLFASSIQRFLNTEKDGSIEMQNKIFSMGVAIHIGIAILFFIIVEIAGIIMIPNLNLHPEKTSVAILLLQFSIFSSIVTILTIPYDALMMAKEKFDAIAAFSLLESILKLGIVFLLLISPIDKVIFYSILLFCVSLLIRTLNASYCTKKFGNIAKCKFIKDKILLQEMTHFAGWNFLGNLGFSLTNQGLNFVLNLFGGVVANAARTIAYQVNDNMRSFVVDISLAFTPQSMMSYKDNKDRFYNLQFFSSKASSAIFLILVFPIYLMTEPILKVWLGECPMYAVAFIHGIIFYSMIRNWHGPIDIAFKSANRIRNYQIFEVTIMVLNLPISWIILHLGAPIYSVFVVMTVIEMINMVTILIMATRQIDFPIWSFVKKVIVPTCIVILILSMLYVGYNYISITPDNIFKLISWGIVEVIVAVFFCTMIIFNKGERSKIIELIKKRNT